MPIKISSPLVQTFILEETDRKYGCEGEPTTVTIKQAAQHEHEQRQQTFATLERRFNDTDPEQTTLVQTANMEQLKRLETWLTLCECNIMDDDGTKPLFPSRKGENGLPRLAMNKGQFEIAWGKLPPDVAAEIHEKVTEMNIMWSGRGG